MRRPAADHLRWVNFDISRVVFQHGGHVVLRELVLSEHEQQEALPAGPVPHDHQLLTDNSHLDGQHHVAPFVVLEHLDCTVEEAT